LLPLIFNRRRRCSFHLAQPAFAEKLEKGTRRAEKQFVVLPERHTLIRGVAIHGNQVPAGEVPHPVVAVGKVDFRVQIMDGVVIKMKTAAGVFADP
jgi:hypothetical protein